MNGIRSEDKSYRMAFRDAMSKTCPRPSFPGRRTSSGEHRYSSAVGSVTRLGSRGSCANLEVWERLAICELFKGCRRLPLVKIRLLSTREIRAKDQIDFKGLSGTRLPSRWNLNQGDLCPLTIKEKPCLKEKPCQRPQNVMS